MGQMEEDLGAVSPSLNALPPPPPPPPPRTTTTTPTTTTITKTIALQPRLEPENHHVRPIPRNESR